MSPGPAPGQQSPARPRDQGWAARAADLGRRLQAPAIAAALGAVAGFGQAPTSWPAAILIGVAGAAALLTRAPSTGAAAGVGWAMGVGYFLPGLLWIGEAFLVDADTFAWLRPFAITLLPAGLALFWAAAFAAAHAAAQRLRAPASSADTATILLLAVFWAAAEWARGHVLTGFPWGLFAYAWIDTPAAQTAAWLGPYALNALTIAVGGALGLALVRRGASRRLALGAALATITALSVAGGLRLAPATIPEDAPVLRLVQPNVPQREKWVEEFRTRNIRRLIDLSQNPDRSGSSPQLIVWPETATPFLVAQNATVRQQLIDVLPAGASLALGSYRAQERPDGGEDWFNSLVVVDPSARASAVYDKHHLVPFGEFLPFQETMQQLGVFQLAGGVEGFAAGPGPMTLAPPGAPRFAPLICYEAVFPHEMPAPSDRPELLLQITNDAWFGDSGGPRQHLVQARFRAIEQGLAFFRSANTGVTAAIDPYGRVLAMLDIGEMGALDQALPAPLPPTVFSRWGEWATPLLLAAMLLAAVASARSRA